MRLRDEAVELDAPAIALLADAWLPAAFPRLTEPAAAPTIDLTVHFRRAAPAAGEHVLGVFTSTCAAEGLFEEDGALWCEDGLLLAPEPAARAPAVTGHLGPGVEPRRPPGPARGRAPGAARHGRPRHRGVVVYETDPVGEVLDQPPFLNAAAAVRTALGPEALLDACKAVEAALGRDPHGRRHGPRPIDVDVLLLGGLAHRSDRLVVPHPELLRRRFVLGPLLELDLELRAPTAPRWPRPWRCCRSTRTSASPARRSLLP
jgi:2-amino-4-hydroxy-6-hydroxymethyldihydropteridine diphosphokinase